MKNKKWIYPLTFSFIVLAIWELSVLLLNVPNYLLPSPMNIVKALVSEANVLWFHTLVTLLEAFIGLIIAFVLGFIVSILMDHFPLVRSTIYPHLVVSQTIPVMVLAPLFSIWFGFGYLPKILMVVLMCFFPITISLSQGFKEVDEKKIQLMKSFQASPFQMYKELKIPTSLTSLFSGLRIAATYCVGGAVVGEWISAQAGLGYYMLRVKNGYELDKVFASIVIVVILSLCFNALVSAFEKWCMPYKREEKKK